MNSLEKLQELLRDLFQLDMADLDFGLYRLLHLKRQEMEAFLTEQLPQRVNEVFQSMAGQEFTDMEKEMSELRDKLRENLGEDALMENGEINPEYRKEKSKITRKLMEAYENIRERIQSIKVTEAQQAEVFNHLYAFFSRYYEGGDFIPRRRYGSRETYAVPYNGEEVLFHWANKDQHYVKTGENFKDYTFTVDILGGPYQIRFVLTEANLPPGNTKGDTRYFFPLPDQASFEEKGKVFRLPFQYRLPTEQEVISHGKNSRFQESVLQNNLEKIFKSIPNPLLANALAEVIDQKEDLEISLLLKRLRHFCRRNTTDYFIHKNLEGFLKRELEFYLKDQILHLADLEGDFEAKRRILRVTRNLGEEVIAFLSQLEEVQKRLFEKKKFVLRTDYLAPIKEVPKELWEGILKNKDQIKAWQDFFAIDPQEKMNKKFLEDHPTLVINTAFFNPDFTDKLLESFDDLDEVTDGLLIHSENYQALRFLERTYADKVKCIYIDPPYNTGYDGFLYKDQLQHSSWITSSFNRIQLCKSLIVKDGAIFVSIGNEECANLRVLIDSIWGRSAFKSNIIQRRGIKSVQAQFDTIDALNQGYDNVMMFTPNPLARFNKLMIPKLMIDDNEEANDLPIGSWNNHWRGTDRPSMRYSLFGRTPATGQWRWSKERSEKAIESYECLLSELGKNNPQQKEIDTWIQEQDIKGERLDLLRLSSTGKPEHYIRPSNEKLANDLWIDLKPNGSKQLAAIFGSKVFDNPKSVGLIKRICQLMCDDYNLCLDFYAGSGTTGHGVIEWNRENDLKCKFILVELGQYFDTVLLPRIQKVIYTPEWKDGKPKRLPTEEEIERSPRLIKILRLESYEDALHNLTTEKTLKREEKKAKSYKENLGTDRYRLSYLVRLPLEASASMLNISALEHPFDYRIEVLTEQGPKIETVDLVETFNFLYGLHVQRLEKWENKKDNRFYRVVKARDRKERKVLILWRDMKDLDPKTERQFLEAKIKEGNPFDEILINGDSAVPGVKSLDGIYKRLIEEGER